MLIVACREMTCPHNHTNTNSSALPRPLHSPQLPHHPFHTHSTPIPQPHSHTATQPPTSGVNGVNVLASMSLCWMLRPVLSLGYVCAPAGTMYSESEPAPAPAPAAGAAAPPAAAPAAAGAPALAATSDMATEGVEVAWRRETGARRERQYVKTTGGKVATQRGKAGVKRQRCVCGVCGCEKRLRTHKENRGKKNRDASFSQHCRQLQHPPLHTENRIASVRD